ncbi:MAG: FtsX-like permease family protein [Planctomycetes bacterium]|nr:FtsX-like permease family protein [Planctomycetota bacterium]
MKQIRVADQPRLSFARTLMITVNGLRYRLFRALVTVAVICVAVAFLMNVVSESLIKRSVLHHTRDRIARMHLVYYWATRLTTPGSPEDILAELARAREDDATYREVAVMTGLTPTAMAEFHEDARRAARYLAFFDGLNYGRRRSLIHSSAGVAIFDRLATPAGLERFAGALQNMKSVRFVTSTAELKSFLERWPLLAGRIDQARRGQEKAAARVRLALDGRAIYEALAEVASGDSSFADVIREAGYNFDAESAQPVVAPQARRILETRAIEKSLESPAARQALAQRRNVLPADVTMKMMWRTLRSRRAADWYANIIRDASARAIDLDGERLVRLARGREEELVLAKAERLTADVGTGGMGLGQRMFWLILVSMLVCIIGISNAMLMSVTERFREIATMKCLGATDGFVMGMFVLESCFMGVAGGCIGGMLGALLGLARMAIVFGSGYALSVPAAELLAAVGVAAGVGVVLAAIAAVYPAWRAARLAPMEAMRIE